MCTGKTTAGLKRLKSTENLIVHRKGDRGAEETKKNKEPIQVLDLKMTAALKTLKSTRGFQDSSNKIGVEIFSESNKMGVEMHFECDFSDFMIQT